MKEKNNSLNYFIFGIIILILAVGAWIIISDFNFGGKAPVPYSVYNNYVIYEVNDGNVLRYKVEAIANNGVKYTHFFRNLPSDLLNLTYDKDVRGKVLYNDNFLQKDKIYFTYDPDMNGNDILASGTLVQILGTNSQGIFKIPVVQSVTRDNNNPDFPIKTCGDATPDIGVIELKYGDPGLYSDGECVIIQGNTREDFIKYNDLLSYILLEVIQ
jgi:hypothetical protein